MTKLCAVGPACSPRKNQQHTQAYCCHHAVLVPTPFLPPSVSLLQASTYRRPAGKETKRGSKFELTEEQKQEIREAIELPSLYYAHPRQVVERKGLLVAA
mgnify:CR=1 FL=1